MQKKNPIIQRWRLILGGVVVLVILGAALFYFTSGSRADPQQPFSFPHKVMVGAGVPCLYCHAYAIKSPVAEIPSVEKCMGCHKVIATNTPRITTLRTQYWEKQKPIEWVKVYDLPRFVYFSHEVHVEGAGLNCETCHGNVGQMNEAVKVANTNMGWCLGCHEKQPNYNQLMDCVVCHK
jgi:c(7)-type cytochrome triheme protein